MNNQTATLNSLNIWITRAAHQQQELKQKLEKMGAQVHCFPTLFIKNITLSALLCERLQQRKKTDWWIFTSANGVHAAADLLRSSAGSETLIACVGPKTATCLQEYGHQATFISSIHHAEAFAKELLQLASKSTHFHIFRALEVREVLENTLIAQGHQVSSYVLYETLRHKDCNAHTLQADLKKNVPTDVIFASPSSVRHFCSCLNPDTRQILTKTRWHSIGPITSQEIEKRLGQVSCEAFPHTLEALIPRLTALPSISGIM